MNLPNSKKAYVPKEKLLGYLLSETHPVGKSKARFFHKLGFNETNVDKLEQSLLSIAKINDVENVKEISYGVNYIIKGSIKLPSRKAATVKTVWFIESGKTSPRFVTAIPDIISKDKRRK